jgi:hypothetical protein
MNLEDKIYRYLSCRQGIQIVEWRGPGEINRIVLATVSFAVQLTKVGAQERTRWRFLRLEDTTHDGVRHWTQVDRGATFAEFVVFMEDLLL